MIKKEKTTAEDKWFKVSKRVWLPINTEKTHDDFVPKKIPFGDNKKLVESVSVAISKSMPVLLIGETGTGKTSLVRHLASKTNNAFVRVNHNGGTTIEDLVGRWTIDSKGSTVWIDGLLIEAMKKGWWFLADEINVASAEINFVYHSLLDDDSRIVMAEKGNEVVVAHKNFRFFGAMNPPAEYAGTKELNKALMSRFIVSKVDFPEPKIEEKILTSRAGIEEDVAERMVRFASEIRILHSKEEVRFVMSTRDLLMWATMYKVYNKYMLSAETTILNKITQDDYDAIKDMMGLTFKALDANKDIQSGTPTEDVDENTSTESPF